MSTQDHKQERPPSINNTVSLLNKFDRPKLTELEANFATHSQLLRPGMELGEDEDNFTLEELTVRAQVSKSGLELIHRKANELLPKIKSRIKTLSTVQLVSQIIVSISGASLILLLEENFGYPIKLTIGALTLIAGILSIIVQQKSGTIAFGENSLSKTFNSLTDYKISSDYLIQELTILEEIGYSSKPKKTKEVISKANEMSWNIQKIIEKY